MYGQRVIAAMLDFCKDIREVAEPGAIMLRLNLHRNPVRVQISLAERPCLLQIIRVNICKRNLRLRPGRATNTAGSGLSDCAMGRSTERCRSRRF